MCKNITSIIKTRAGILYKCNECDLYQLVYKNILLEFTAKEFESFRSYLEFLETKHNDKGVEYTTNHKIPIPTLQQNLFLIFKKQEFEDLKKLVFGPLKQQYHILKGHEIEYQFLKN